MSLKDIHYLRPAKPFGCKNFEITQRKMSTEEMDRNSKIMDMQINVLISDRLRAARLVAPLAHRISVVGPVSEGRESSRALSDAAHQALRRGGRGHQRHVLHSVVQSGCVPGRFAAIYVDIRHCVPKSEKCVPDLVSHPRTGEPGRAPSPTH